MRKQSIQPEDIIEAAIKLAAEVGLENLATKKVANACGVSEGSLFHYFSTKQELLERCLYHIDKALNETLSNIPRDSENAQQYYHDLWVAYFKHILHHVEYTKFYQSFRQSSYYSIELFKNQQNTLTSMNSIKTHFEDDSNPQNRFLWVYLTEASIGIAQQMANGILPESEENIELIYQLLTQGSSSLSPQ